MTSTATRPPARSSTPSSGGSADGTGLLQRALPVLARLESPVTSYYVLLGTTVILVVIGLVMVLSASMITSYRDDGSTFLALPVVGVAEFRDGKITEWREYYDSAGVPG